MQEGFCDLKVQVNGQHVFFVNKKTLCAYSGKMKKLIKQVRPPSQSKPNSKPRCIKITDFPGGPDGFDLVARFCYGAAAASGSEGDAEASSTTTVAMTPSNIALLHTSATYMEMTEDVHPGNLLSHSEAFLDGLFCWSWSDILAALKSCDRFHAAADSSGLLQRLVASLLVKISANNAQIPFFSLTPTTTPAPAHPLGTSSSCSSSPDTFGLRFSSCSTRTPDTARPCVGREWWFDDLTHLCPATVELILRTLGAYGEDNKNLILTRFLLHYLKTAASTGASVSSYAGLADTAVHGVVLIGRAAFTCRMLFWVMRVVSGLGLSRECRNHLERVIGLSLDQATLDDLLVSGQANGDIYDVNLVLRLVRVFVNAEEGGVPLPRMKKVGGLMDKYMREISPDQTLKVAKFIALAESLPDSARDCYDGLYRAMDIYIESHPALTPEDRSRLCRCLNYEKLTLEACKDLAKNPRIPPRVTVQALICQQPKIQHCTDAANNGRTPSSNNNSPTPAEAHPKAGHRYRMSGENDRALFSPPPQPQPPSSGFADDNSLKFNLHKMQGRVVELEKVYREMKGQMSKMDRAKQPPSMGAASPLHAMGRGLPRLC